MAGVYEAFAAMARNKKNADDAQADQPIGGEAELGQFGSVDVDEPIEEFTFYVDDQKKTTTGLIYKLFLQNNGVFKDADPFNLGENIDNNTNISFQGITNNAPVALAVRAMTNDMYKKSANQTVNVIYISDMGVLKPSYSINNKGFVCVIFQDRAELYNLTTNSRLQKFDDNAIMISGENADGTNAFVPLQLQMAWKIKNENNTIVITKSIDGINAIKIYTHNRTTREHGDGRIHTPMAHGKTPAAPRNIAKPVENFSSVINSVVQKAKQIAGNDEMTKGVIDVWVKANEKCMELHKIPRQKDNTVWVKTLIQTWIRVVNFRVFTHYKEFQTTNAYVPIKNIVKNVIEIAIDMLRGTVQSIDDDTVNLFLGLFNNDDEREGVINIIKQINGRLVEEYKNE